MSDKHISVLLDEAIEGLNIQGDKVYVDGTLGRGGHSKVILDQLDTGSLYAFDKDQSAIDSIDFKQDNFHLIKADFKDMSEKLHELGVDGVDGILLDIGVSSPQFDQKERGFSYRFDDKLDMRMDTSQKLNAYIVVNKYSESDLTSIFYEYGEERYAKSIAKNIVEYRKTQSIKTTFQLVDIIKASLPNKELRKKGHPAKKVFQAIRIEVNDELGALKTVIETGSKLLNSKGRMVIITFHSLEDRIVKQMFRKLEVGDRIDVSIPMMPDQIEESDYKVITRRPIMASESEISNNKRSRSAKLRILERV